MEFGSGCGDDGVGINRGSGDVGGAVVARLMTVIAIVFLIVLSVAMVLSEIFFRSAMIVLATMDEMSALVHSRSVCTRMKNMTDKCQMDVGTQELN